MSKIFSKDISVIVQGKVDLELTHRCIETIRQYLPAAEVILSTWKGEDIYGMDVDKVIYNKDPGSSGFIRKYPKKQYNNVNREMLSTHTGLLASTRPYCLKIRTDMELTSDNFLNMYELFHKTTIRTSVFKERVMVEGLTTSIEYPFCVGDWWFFGRKDDLLDLFSGEVYNEEYLSYQSGYRKKFDWIICRYIPEQYIIYSFLKKKYNISFYGHADCSDNVMRFSRKFIFENLICIEPEESGIYLKKALNIVYNPTSWIFGIPFLKWYSYLRKGKSIPQLQFYKYMKLKIKYEKEVFRYNSNFLYYGLLNETNIVKNYSDNKNISVFDAKMLQEDNLTFVITGRAEVYGKFNAARCLKSVKKYFPKAKIVLSAWENEDFSLFYGLYDELVINKLPTEKMLEIHLKDSSMKKKNSMNLQQQTVNAGLKKVKTDFAVRLRTDFYFTNSTLINEYNNLQRVFIKYEVERKIFNQRVLTIRYITSDSRMTDGKFAGGISDVFHVGLTQDLLKLWDGTPYSKDDMEYFSLHPEISWENPYKFNHRYNAEQSFFYKLIKKENLSIPIPNYYFDGTNEECVYEHERVLASNFLVLSQVKLGLHSKFHRCFHSPDDSDAFFRFWRFAQIYLLYVDHDNYYCKKILKKYAFQENIKRILHEIIKRTLGKPKKYFLHIAHNIFNKFSYYMLNYVFKLLIYNKELLTENLKKGNSGSRGKMNV